MKFRLMIVTLVLLLFTTGFGERTKAAETFNDLGSVKWAESSIYYLTNKNIISGVGNGKFAPNEKITRSQAAALLVRALYPNEAAPANPNFKDMDSSHYFYKDIATAVEKEIFGGYPDHTFRPDHKISRAETAAILSNAYIIDKGTETVSFKDLNESAWAKESIINLASNKLVSGYEDQTFRPQNSVTRAEFAAMMASVLQFTEAEEVSNPTPGSAELVETAKVFDEGETKEFFKQVDSVETTYTESGKDIIFTGAQIGLESLKKDDIFFLSPTAAYPLGFIGKVASVEVTNGETVAAVKQPELHEAFSEVDVQVNEPLTSDQIIHTETLDGVEFIIEPAIEKGADGSITIAGLGDVDESVDKTFVGEFGISVNKVFKPKASSNFKGELNVGGKFAIRNPAIDLAYKHNAKASPPYIEIERLKAKVAGTIYNNITVNTKIDGSFGIGNLVKIPENKVNLWGLELEGVASDKNKVTLANAVIGTSYVYVTVATGEQVKVPVAAVIAFTMTSGGEVNAELSFEVEVEEEIEKGFDFKLKDNKVVDHDIWDYSKMDSHYFLGGKGEAALTNGVGIDFGLVIGGLVPAKISNDLALKSTLKGEIGITDIIGDEDPAEFSGCADYVGELGVKSKLDSRVIMSISNWQSEFNHDWTVFDKPLAKSEFGSCDNLSWDGQWSNDYGTVAIANETPSSFDFDIHVSSGGHVGMIDGTAAVDGDQAVYEEYIEDLAVILDDPVCRITFTHLGESIDVKESEACFVYHGMAVSFTGEFFKDSSSDSGDDPAASFFDEEFVTLLEAGCLKSVPHCIDGSIKQAEADLGPASYDGYLEGAQFKGYDYFGYYHLPSYENATEEAKDRISSLLFLPESNDLDLYIPDLIEALGEPYSHGASDMYVGEYILTYKVVKNGRELKLYIYVPADDYQSAKTTPIYEMKLIDKSGL